MENINEKALALLGIITDGTSRGLSSNETYRKILNDPLNHKMFGVIKDLIFKLEEKQNERKNRF